MIVWPGIAWCHDTGTQIHHGLIKISRPIWVNQNIQNFHKDLTAFRQGNIVFEPEEASYNPEEVAVQGRRHPTKGHGGDGSRRIGANTFET